MKRFYKEAGTAPVAGGHGVLLDGKPVKTPARAPLVAPTAALARAVAAEWQAQGEKIDPGSMPLMRLLATAIDRVPLHRSGVEDDLAAFAAAGFAYLPWLPLCAVMIAAGFLGTLFGRAIVVRMPERAFRMGFRLLLTALALRILWQAAAP